MRKRAVRVGTRGEGRIVQGEAAATPRPTATAAALGPAPATAVAVPHPPLHHQRPPAVHHSPPPREGRGGAAALLPIRPTAAAVVEVAAHTGGTVTVARRSGTGEGAAQSALGVTRETAATPGSAGAEGADPGTGIGAGAGPGTGTAVVAAETETERRTEIKRGRGAGNAGKAVTAVAANTNRRPQARTGKGGKTGAAVMTRTRKRKRRRENLTERKRSQRLRRKKGRKVVLLWQRRMANQRKGKRATLTQTLRVTSTPDRIARPARRALPKLVRGAQTLTLVGPLPLKLARKRNLRNPNAVVQGRWKNLTSLVRRQAANTSLSRDQGSIRFFLFTFLLYSFHVCLCVMSLEGY